MQKQMAEERHAFEEERTKLRTEWAGRQQKRIQELEAQLAEMHKRFAENVSRVVEAVKERDTTRTDRENFATEIRPSAEWGAGRTEFGGGADNFRIAGGLGSCLRAMHGPVSAELLQPGAKIRVRGFSKPVILRRLDGQNAEIEAGPLRMKIAKEEIVGVESAPAGRVLSPNAVSGSLGSPSRFGVANEINVIGQSVEQGYGASG